MKLLSLDLELNLPSRKVIQVGACIIDTDKEKITEKFMVYVNPKEPIAEEITELTGITQNDVDTMGYSVQEAYLMLKEFHKKNKCFINPVLWGSGIWNDSAHLFQEANIPGEMNFTGYRVIDAKTLYQSLRIRSSQKVKGGLATAMTKMGMNFEGRPHDALADAINTARIWLELTKPFKLYPKARSPQDL